MRRESIVNGIKRRLLTNKGAEVLLGLNEEQIAIVNALLLRGLHGNTANSVMMRLLNESLEKHVHLVKPQ